MGFLTGNAPGHGRGPQAASVPASFTATLYKTYSVRNLKDLSFSHLASYHQTKVTWFVWRRSVSNVNTFYASLERMQEAMHGISLKVCSRDKSPHLSFTDTRAPVEERAGMAHTLLSQPLEPWKFEDGVHFSAPWTFAFLDFSLQMWHCDDSVSSHPVCDSRR